MKKMSKGMLMTALICGAVYLGGSPVYANELQEFALDEYVVTAARTETKLVDTPANISVVDAQTIEERHYQDVSEVLKDVPGATVLDTGVGTYEKIIRLNGDDRILVLVDGRRVNVEIGATSGGRSNFDMNQLPDVGVIERIEVLKGGGGALYGSDAVGGVINIITKKVNNQNGKIAIGVGSNDSKDYKLNYSYKQGKTGISLSASEYKQDYFKYRDAKTDTTKRWQYPSNYENKKVSLKIEQDINDTNSLTFGYDYSKYEGMSPNVFGLNVLDKNTKNLYARYDWINSDDNAGYLSYHHNEYNYFNENLIGWYTIGDMNEKTDGIDVQQQIKTSYNNNLVVGASWRESKVKVTGDNNYNKTIDNMSVFLNDTYRINSKLSLNGGVRYDNHSEAGDETTMSFAVNKKFDEHSHIYFNWSQVFKAPTTDDLFTNNPSMGIGNSDLKPETGDTWTIGYATELNDKTSAGISYFESNLDDAIAWKAGKTKDDPYQVSNVDEQKKKGLELTLSHKLSEQFDIVATYTYLNVEEKTQYTGGKFVKDTNAIPNMYRFGIKYTDIKWNADLFMRAGSGASPDKYVDSNYITVDCAITYKATNDLSFYAKGYNLLNEAYAEFGGRDGGSYNYPAQSRRFIVGAEYKF